MDYGKLAYIKVNDIEKRLGNVVVTESSSGLNCFEVTSAATENISSGETRLLSMVYPNAKDGVCVFSKFTVTSQTSQEITLNLQYSGLTFASVTKSVTAGETTDLDISSVASGVIASDGELGVAFTSEREFVLSSIKVIVLGATAGESSTKIELKGCEIGSKICVSYIKDGKIYYCLSSPDTFDINNSTFLSYKSAQTHSCCFDRFSKTDDLYFAYTNSDGGLYLAKVGENSETYIDSMVTSVCVGSSNNASDNCLLIVYVKQGSVYYKTLTEGVLSDATKISLPDANFITVRVANTDSQKNYIIATDDENNNYFCQSVLPMDASKLFDSIAFNAAFTISCFINPLSGDNASENITCELALAAYCEIVAENSYDFTDATDLNVEMDFTFEAFTIPDDAVLYGVKFNTLSNNAGNGVINCLYTDDCVGFIPATIAMASSTSQPSYSDGSWANRWPYNAIKPVIIKNGFKTYLNENDFTKTVDGASVDISTGADGDVFIEIPKIYYRYNLTSDRVLEFKMSSCKRAGFCALSHIYKGQELDYIYIAAFPSTLIDNKTYSLAGPDKLLARDKTTQTLREFAQNRGEGFEMMSLNPLNLIEMLFIIQFKSIDYRTSIGYGYSFNSVASPFLTTGTSLAYPAKTYGYLTYDQRKVDRYMFIEAFCSFADFALDGYFISDSKIGFMNFEGKSNNWIDDTNYKDYMFFDIAFPNATRVSLNHIVDNRLGLLACEFGAKSSVTRPFDFFRSRFNTRSTVGYRMHFPNLGTDGMGLFSYNFPILNYRAGIQGHRMICYVQQKEAN